MSLTPEEKKLGKAKIKKMKVKTFRDAVSRAERARKERERYWSNPEVRERKRTGRRQYIQKIHTVKGWVAWYKNNQKDVIDGLPHFMLGDEKGGIPGCDYSHLKKIGPFTTNIYEKLANVNVLPKPKLSAIKNYKNGYYSKNPMEFYSYDEIYEILSFFSRALTKSPGFIVDKIPEEISQLHIKIQGLRNG